MVLQKQQELEVHLQTADEVCRLGQEDSVLLIDALEREDKLRVSSCHIKCGGGRKGSFQGERGLPKIIDESQNANHMLYL